MQLYKHNATQGNDTCIEKGEFLLSDIESRVRKERKHIGNRLAIHMWYE